MRRKSFFGNVLNNWFDYTLYILNIYLTFINQMQLILSFYCLYNCLNDFQLSVIQWKPEKVHFAFPPSFTNQFSILHCFPVHCVSTFLYTNGTVDGKKHFLFWLPILFYSPVLKNLLICDYFSSSLFHVSIIFSTQFYQSASSSTLFFVERGKLEIGI